MTTMTRTPPAKSGKPSTAKASNGLPSVETMVAIVRVTSQETARAVARETLPQITAALAGRADAPGAASPALDVAALGEAMREALAPLVVELAAQREMLRMLVISTDRPRTKKVRHERDGAGNITKSEVTEE